MKSKFPIIITSLFLVTLFSPYVASAEKVHLTNNDYEQKYPNYSPDGTKIVYSSEEDGDSFSDIWVMDADGSNHVQLTDQLPQVYPIWSPDGQRIIYGSFEDGDEYIYDLWIINSDGTNHIQLNDLDGDDSIPGSFSPDGSRIAFHTQDMHFPDSGQHTIWTMNVDGTGNLQELGHGKYPMYSPDGNSIIYSSEEDGGYYWDLWVMDVDGSNRLQLTFDGADQLYPTFNQDGTRVAYSSKQASDYYDIWVMKSDGSNQIRLTEQDSDQMKPSFNDDGSLIAYHSDEDGMGHIDIWTLDYRPSPNEPPSATVSVNPTSGSAPLEVSFTGSGSDSDGSIASYSWDFGDGTSSTQQNPSHTYQNAGSFTATLTVTDDEGATDTTTIQITSDDVGDAPEDPPPPPQSSTNSNLDSDGDGVPDSDDQCPGTPSGTLVLINGCAPQSDSTSEEDSAAIPGFSVIVAISAICVAATTINSRKKRRLNECDDINSV